MLDLEKKIQIANSFRDDIMDSRTPAMVSEVQSHPPGRNSCYNEISSNYSSRNKIQKVTTMASHGTKEATASHGRTETTEIGRIRIVGRGKIKIKSHGKAIIKSKVINPATLAYFVTGSKILCSSGL